jgi:hypothetical protein
MGMLTDQARVDLTVLAGGVTRSHSTFVGHALIAEHGGVDQAALWIARDQAEKLGGELVRVTVDGRTIYPQRGENAR